jgi:hypothetical protein
MAGLPKGFGTKDLREAKSLLDELAEQAPQGPAADAAAAPGGPFA